MKIKKLETKPYFRDVRKGDITDIGIILDVYEDENGIEHVVLDRNVVLSNYSTTVARPTWIKINFTRLRRQLKVLDKANKKPSFRATAKQISNFYGFSTKEAFTVMFDTIFQEELLKKIEKQEQLIIKRIKETSSSFGL